MAAVSGMAFANILVFAQLGILGSLGGATKAPYNLFTADIMIYAEDVNTLTDNSNTRGVPSAFFEDITMSNPLVLEVNDTTLSAVGALDIGGGFGSDGTLIISDQTFLGLFPQRLAGAPNYILVNVEDGVSPGLVIERLRKVLPADTVQVRTLADAASAHLKFQTTEKPTGIIFGFGVLVGIVIVHQVLSTDVASHLHEYETFKAMGFGHKFFLGIVFEGAMVLAVFGNVPGFIISIGLYKALNAATGLEDRLGYLPANLSGGQKQRVAVARALVSNPDIVFADEPTAALDKMSSFTVVAMLKKLGQTRGTTTVMVTHDNRILEMADRIITLEDGKIVKDTGQIN